MSPDCLTEPRLDWYGRGCEQRGRGKGARTPRRRSTMKFIARSPNVVSCPARSSQRKRWSMSSRSAGHASGKCSCCSRRKTSSSWNPIAAPSSGVRPFAMPRMFWRPVALSNWNCVKRPRKWPAGPTWKRLRGIISEERQALKRGDREQIMQISGKFHVALAEAAGNPILSDFLNSLISRCYLILRNLSATRSQQLSARRPCQHCRRAREQRSRTGRDGDGRTFRTYRGRTRPVGIVQRQVRT